MALTAALLQEGTDAMGKVGNEPRWKPICASDHRNEGEAEEMEKMFHERDSSACSKTVYRWGAQILDDFRWSWESLTNLGKALVTGIKSV